MAARPHCYEHPHPALTTDVVLFTVQDAQLQVLLIRRGGEPFAGRWALPGGFLEIDEGLETCARRELMEETGIGGIYLEQLYTFGQPDRDPRERVISVTFLGLAPAVSLHPRAASDAAASAWFSLEGAPPLAFDHEDIVDLAHRRLRAKLDYSTIGFRLLPETFTLGELQRLYEIIRGEPLDKRNFRKWVLGLDELTETGAQRRNGNHRPARVYRLKHPERVTIIR
jgi:8-oxo-dGTP diphosphatase